jgi:5'-3' exonuclease
VDFSAVAVSSAMISIAQKIDLDENYMRHVTLNVIRAARKKYFKEYGEVVICVDGQHYWRKRIFPHYKANRKAARKDSGVNWPYLFEIIDRIHHEIEENFPYKVLKVDTAEADDIIATICLKEPGPHMIVSNDKDFKQLQRLPGIAMYSPGLSSEIKCDNPDTFLVEHIIRGDQSDGIPNVLSDDDTFVNPDKRQRRLTDAKVNEWLTSVPENVFDERTLENYNRNENLISLFKLPDELVENIHQAYIKKEVTGHRGIKLMKYFMDKGLRNLVENLEEF